MAGGGEDTCGQCSGLRELGYRRILAPAEPGNEGPDGEAAGAGSSHGSPALPGGLSPQPGLLTPRPALIPVKSGTFSPLQILLIM